MKKTVFYFYKHICSFFSVLYSTQRYIVSVPCSAGLLCFLCPFGQRGRRVTKAINSTATASDISLQSFLRLTFSESFSIVLSLAQKAFQFYSLWPSSIIAESTRTTPAQQVRKYVAFEREK
jgi:hypothetical protein